MQKNISTSAYQHIITSLSVLFILLNAVLIYNENYWLLLLPLAIIIILLSVISLDKLILFIVFCTPLSITLQNYDARLALALPTEPLIFGAMILVIIKVFYERKFDVRIINHPISYAIFFSSFWTFITCFTSEMPLVSFKFLISKLWFIITFYFIATLMFKHYSNIKKFFWLYIIPLSVVIIYTVIRHSFYGFEQKPAHWVMDPFFNDHTSYGAIMAMFFPVLFLLFKSNYSKTIKLIVCILFLIFTIGIILSYTRAAWVSLIVAFGLYLIYLFRIKLRTLIITGLCIIGLAFAFVDDILMKLEKNRQDASTDLAEHVQSISNISSDASNLERLNRWQAAFRMFNERPIFGWGPGTYMFIYAPFQHSSEKTIISTNAGNLGNAHSEYIGPLAEQGVLGSLSFIIILICVYHRGTKLYFNLENNDSKRIVLVVLLGLTTYIVHGFLNNFLDTDKAAVPFWGFIAIIAALDIYHNKTEHTKI